MLVGYVPNFVDIELPISENNLKILPRDILFVRIDSQQTIIKKFNCTSFQMIIKKLNTKNGKRFFLLTVIYIQPKKSKNEKSETCQIFLECLTPEPEPLHIAWDFTIDNSCKNVKLTKLKDNFRSYHLSNLSVVGYSRETSKSRTYFDVVCCSNTVAIEIFKSAVTAHYTVQIVFFEFFEKTVPVKTNFTEIGPFLKTTWI